ncbi:MAG: biopolymer transporter ExbD [Victivallales bacterium]|nr:biopolymer transporter ExbD [Victivallales bacterium]
MYERNTHRKRLAVISEINMTPLMDLTFTLLIVFIITVPILDYTSDVTPPKMTTPQEVTSSTMANAIMVELDDKGQISIGGNSVPFAEIEDQFRAFKDAGKSKIVFRADGTRPYDDIVAVMRAANHADLAIQLMTQQE